MLTLVHGIGKHCCRPGYVGLFESLSGTGVDAHGLDHHDHNRSNGAPRGYEDKFDDYVSDLLDYVRHCRGKYADSGDTCPPLILMGQSMGGLVCIMAALSLGSNQVRGIILMSPTLGVDMDLILKIQNFFAPTIDKFLPKTKIVDTVNPQDLSRNPMAVRAYIDDPLTEKGKLVARTAIGMDKAFNVVKARRGEITCPILLLHGTNFAATNSVHKYNNSGADGHYISKKDWCQAGLLILQTSTRKVGVANRGTSKAKYITQLPFQQLSARAKQADTFQDFPTSLMSVSKTANNGTVSVFTKEGDNVFKEEDVLITCKGNPILIGVRDSHGQYRIPLMQQRGQWQPRRPSKQA
jgi:alpha-beta hydrolase superfamily lysophospholipase